MRVRELATANCARWQSIRCAPEAARVRPGWVARDARCLPRTQLAMTRMICTAGCDACRKSIAPLHRPGIRSNVLLSEMKYGALKTPTETTILPAQTRRRTSQWIPLCRIGTKTLRRTDVPTLSPLISPNRVHLARLGQISTSSSRINCISNGAGVPLHPGLLKCAWLMTALLVT